MPYRVYGEEEMIEVDSPDEIAPAIMALRAMKHPSAQRSNGLSVVAPLRREHRVDSIADRWKRIQRDLSAEHKSVIRKLSRHPEGVSSAVVGLERAEMGGFIATLSKAAKSEGLNLDDLIVRSKGENPDGSTVNTYALTDAVREVVEA